MATDPTGSVVRNLFAIQRLANGVNRDAVDLIEELFDDIIAQLSRIDPTAPKADRWQRQRVGKLIGDVEARAREAFQEIHRQVRQQLAEVGVQQGEWAAGQLERWIAGVVAVDVRAARIGVNLMKSILDTDPIQGELLGDWFSQQGDRVPILVRRQIQLGMAQNETLGDLVRRVRGRSAGRGRYVGGVMQTTTREAESVIRTAVNEISNRAHLETYEQNGDITEEYEYTAVLDSRTTLVCASLDGRRFRYDDPDRRVPPQHWRCRSSTTAVIKWAELGIEPPDEGTRASQFGQVKASLHFERWLRQQSKSWQDEFLGPARAELFRAGKVGLRDLVRRDNSIVTIAELRQKAA